MNNKADKLQKKALREQQRRMKPGECQKFVRLILDASFFDDSHWSALIAALDQMQLKYEKRNLPEQQCVMWERCLDQQTLSIGVEETAIKRGAGSSASDSWQLEQKVLRLLTEQELQNAVRCDKLQAIGARLHAVFPAHSHTVVVPQQLKQKANTDTALIELQVLQQVAVLAIPMGKDMHALAALLRRLTKSIAEAPYKQQRSEALNSFKKYLANDKRQCVRVDGRNGLGRLWQQQLMRLSTVTLEVAESLIAQYSCPKKLLDAYEEALDAPNLLADVRITRGKVPALQTDRRVGNVLSARLHTLYSTCDPETRI